MSEMSTAPGTINDAGFAPPELPQEDAVVVITVDEAERNHHCDPRRSTAISYECSSDMYLTALLEAIESSADAEDPAAQGVQVQHRADGGRQDGKAGDATAALAVNVLHQIQDRFVQKHVQDGTLMSRTIRFATNATSGEGPSHRRDGTTRMSAARRGRRRPPRRNNLGNGVDEHAAGTNEDRSRTVLSFDRRE